MNNPVIKFFLLRIGMFIAAFLIIWAVLPNDPILAALFGTLISFAVSVIVLRKQRDAMSTHIYNAAQTKRDGLGKPGAPDAENELLDGKSE